MITSSIHRVFHIATVAAIQKVVLYCDATRVFSSPLSSMSLPFYMDKECEDDNCIAIAIAIYNNV